MQLLSSLSALPESSSYDLVVIGAGGAGLAAALFAAIAGQKVLLVERTEYVGGTTAWSGGTTWIPGTRHAASVNPQDTLADAKRYLDNAIGARSPAALRQAFLDHGAQAVELLESRSEVHYRAYPKHPDYISELGGSTLNGRALEPLPFDGRLLGDLFALIRPPIPEFTVLGGMMVDRTDINHLLALGKSFRSFRHAAKLLARHALDRLRHPRGTRLVMGNALVGRLLYSLSRHANVTLALNTSVRRIHREAQGIAAVTLLQTGQHRTVGVGASLVLASGGFNRNAQLRADLLPGVPADWCPSAPGHTGEAHGLAQHVGAHYGQGDLSPAFWAPVSKRLRADGSTAVFPHFMMDRAKPGMLAVNQAGQRFVNESTSYHLFGLTLQQPGNLPAYLVCDAVALRKYGIGMVRPGGKGLEPFLADGYLAQADTLDALAHKLGIDTQGLQASVAQINAYAETGVDPDFQRGSTAYSQNMGDPAAGGKNPNLGPLRQAPYYAVRLYPGDIGAATGFATNADAQVLGEDNTPIPGLYAVGNDMQSIMGGVYTAPGITLGPGVVFAYLAARHAAARNSR
ncbi:succinate dehydrogenase/fumarate reductase flavoprotein subunit [Rhodoferax ferrireducens]|uniref:Succinate dehydrogenase/fumarate reductase flavoprotein subunit n=1 Tax=Rhodoferax ferrireducens TaxID=192843 RepID=A0ABU2C2U8_9BURK|nr:FAD-dependent oxidoreductase [Rhodoferax ferrireducens]MDR7375655.1 succinate dehydrogenase/fumarate reductase flavoprotein subunit [Rhodoferax ferrireducens]